MIKRLLIFLACVAIAAMSISLLDLSRLHAQEGGDPDDPGSFELAIPPTSPDAEQVSDGVTIINYAPDDPESTSADEIEGKNEGGKTDKLPGLEPDQVVGVTMKFGVSKAGTPIQASALDGGTVVAPDEGLIADNDGNVSFKFQVGHEPGLYQVALRDVTHEMGIQFWVVSTETPEDDPPVDLPDNAEEPQP